MTPIMPPEGTQEWRVLQRLLDAKGEWINKQVFIREMYLTQAGRRSVSCPRSHGITASKVFDTSLPRRWQVALSTGLW